VVNNILAGIRGGFILEAWGIPTFIENAGYRQYILRAQCMISNLDHTWGSLNLFAGFTHSFSAQLNVLEPTKE